MSLFFRPSRPEQRVISSLPWEKGGDHATASPSLQGSLSLVPVYAAVRLISESVATLPLQAFRKTPDGRQAIPLPGVFDIPTNTGTRVDWLQRCMTSLLLRGNAYGIEVGADPTAVGMPRMIEWLHPDRVTLDNGRWIYEGREVNGRIIHIPAMTVPGSTLGISPISACAATVTSGNEAQRFVRDWYRNKAVPGMVFRNTQRTVEADVAARAKERLRATLRAGEPFVTGNDWEIDVIKLSADDAGFVAAAKLNATQIATIYGVPPEMIGGESGGSLTYSTVELNQIQFLTNSLRPWLVRLESAFSALMPRPQYVKFNTDALIRIETKARYEVHKIAREIGLNNIDELRALEDRAPLPDGSGADYTPLAAKSAPAKEAR